MLDAGVRRPHRRGGEARAAVGAVDVQPHAELAADLGDGGEVVDDAEVGRARRRHDGEEGLGSVVQQHLAQARRRDSRQLVVHGHVDQLGVHDVAGRLDRRVRAVRSSPPARAARPSPAAAPGPARCAAPRRGPRGCRPCRRGTKTPPAPGGQPGEVGDPAQGLVLGVDGARALEPRPGVDRRGADDDVEGGGLLGRRAGDEGQVARVVDGQAGGGEHVGEDAERPRSRRGRRA